VCAQQGRNGRPGSQPPGGSQAANKKRKVTVTHAQQPGPELTMNISRYEGGDPPPIQMQGGPGQQLQPGFSQPQEWFAEAAYLSYDTGPIPIRSHQSVSSGPPMPMPPQRPEHPGLHMPSFLPPARPLYRGTTSSPPREYLQDDPRNYRQHSPPRGDYRQHSPPREYMREM